MTYNLKAALLEQGGVPDSNKNRCRRVIRGWDLLVTTSLSSDFQLDPRQALPSDRLLFHCLARPVLPRLFKQAEVSAVQPPPPLPLRGFGFEEKLDVILWSRWTLKRNISQRCITVFKPSGGGPGFPIEGLSAFYFTRAVTWPRERKLVMTEGVCSKSIWW